jgi:hypothetical protein
VRALRRRVPRLLSMRDVGVLQNSTDLMLRSAQRARLEARTTLV